MSTNKCDPVLNIQSQQVTIEQIQNLLNIASNRPITIQDIDLLFSDSNQEIQNNNISRETSATSAASQEQSEFSSPNSRGTSGASDVSSSQKTSCFSPKTVRGGWNMPETSHGKVNGVPIEERELNCDCTGN